MAVSMILHVLLRPFFSFCHLHAMCSRARLPEGHLLHLAQYTRLRNVSHVDKDVISRVTVKWGTEPLLIKMVSDKPDAASEDKQAVQCTDLDQSLSQLVALLQ